MRALALLVVAAVAVAQRVAAAEPPLAPHPAHRVAYDSTLGLRVNPLGLEERLNVFLRKRLYADPSPLYREANVAVGFAPTFTPSVIRLGPAFELRPLTILTLTAAGYFQSWMETFGNLQSFRSARAPHSDDDLDTGEAAGRAYGSTGAEIQLRAQLLAKVGPIVVRTDASFHRASVALRDSDHVYYDPRSDLLLANGGWWFVHDSDLVLLTDFGLVAGARATLSGSFFRDKDFAPGEPTDDPNGPTARLGPILAYTFFDRPGAAFNKPTAIVIANWWLAHRYRTGDTSSGALPYLAFAFRFEGDLWRER